MIDQMWEGIVEKKDDAGKTDMVREETFSDPEVS